MTWDIILAMVIGNIVGFLIFDLTVYMFKIKYGKNKRED